MKRSNLWRRIRRAHLLSESVCQWCGNKKDLEVHHIQPFHIRPELELEPLNLITLCGRKNIFARAIRAITGRPNCHLRHGHLGNYKNSNPRICEECAQHKMENEMEHINERALSRANVTRAVTRRGIETTEYEAAKSGAMWSVVAFILGLAGSFGSTIAAAFGANTTAGIVVGTIVTVAGLAAKVLIEMGYIKAREAVKVAAAEAAKAETAQAAVESTQVL